MQQEIEVRFLGVSHEELRQRLTSAGATLVYPMQLMKRVILDYPDRRMQVGDAEYWGWVRVRDEGEKITVTYKKVAKAEGYATSEIELTVSSYEDAITLFRAIGLVQLSEQHTKREKWRFLNCDVTVDEWLWLEPMVEIEGSDEAALKRAAARLGLAWQDATLGNAADAYQKKYAGIREGETIGPVPALTFEFMPEWLKVRTSPDIADKLSAVPDGHAAIRKGAKLS